MSSQEAYIQIASSLGFRRSDKLVGAEPSTIKASFPSSCVCLFICRRSVPSVRLSDGPSVHPLPGIYADLLDLEVHGDAQVITHTANGKSQKRSRAEDRRQHHVEEGSDSERGNCSSSFSSIKVSERVDPASKSSLIGKRLDQVLWGSRSFNQKD